MAAENSRFRSRLFKSLRFGVVLNCICAALFVASIIYNRSSVSLLRRSLDAERLRNADLVTRLNIAIRTITNDVFVAAGAFACSVTNNINQLSPPATSKFAVSAASPSSSFDRDRDLPPLDFHHYMEIDGVPYIYLGRKYYREGDMLLGYPVQLISPDVVQYRDKFYKVVQEIQK